MNKKTKKEEQETIKEEKTTKKEKSQTKWFLLTLLGIFISFLIFYYLLTPSSNFKYGGLSFNTEKYGNILLYHYSYIIENPATKKEYLYNLYLRKDPRKNKIPIYGEIKFFRDKKIYISIDETWASKCEDSVLAAALISQFFSGNFFEVKGAVLNKEFAEKQNFTFANCEEPPNEQKIIILEGNESKIEKKEDCYTISVANCEILSAVEKFVVQTIIDARNRKKELSP